MFNDNYHIIMCLGGEASVANESSNYSSLGTRRDTPYDVLNIYDNTSENNGKTYTHINLYGILA